MELIVIIFIGGAVILYDKNKKKKKQVEEQVELNKFWNRKMLNSVGSQYYIKKYGQEAYDSIMNDTDTRHYMIINYGRD
jgi:hypothetical protein